MNQKGIKTTQEVGDEIHEAFTNLRDEIFKSLRIEILVVKLNKFLKRIWMIKEK